MQFHRAQVEKLKHAERFRVAIEAVWSSVSVTVKKGVYILTENVGRSSLLTTITFLLYRLDICYTVH